jgi:outer membrane translocation and assembly module TamA
VRGFHEGQASPIGEDGAIMGAVAFTLTNLELEQTLFNRLSCFVFLDAIGFCENIADYPFNDCLFSIGTGLSYHTFIGPMRVTFGRNFHQRPSDPRSHFCFSIGFPF